MPANIRKPRNILTCGRAGRRVLKDWLLPHYMRAALWRLEGREKEEAMTTMQPSIVQLCLAKHARNSEQLFWTGAKFDVAERYYALQALLDVVTHNWQPFLLSSVVWKLSDVVAKYLACHVLCGLHARKDRPECDTAMLTRLKPDTESLTVNSWPLINHDDDIWILWRH